MKKSKKLKKIKIGKLELEGTVHSFIALGILIVLTIIYFLSSNAFLITTARYGKGSEIDNNKVKIALGNENTEEKFNLYFQWYNVIHELGHGILMYNSDVKLSNVEEEQLVNDFAVAYWLYYGEEDKINELCKIVEYAVNNIKSDAEDGVTYKEFAERNWNKSSFMTFNNYGWFQYSCVKESLNNKKTLDIVLKEMGIENINLPAPEILEYPVINEEVSTQIINDAVNNFHKWGLKFPNAYQSFSDDPNANYSRNMKNFLGIYNLIYKK